MTKSELKNKIKQLVDLKIAQTKGRTEFKLQTRPRMAEVLAKGMPRYDSAEYKEWSERHWKLFGLDVERSGTKYEIRAHLLAYAYMRGRAYVSVEPNVDLFKNERPSADTIAEIAGVDEDAIDDWLEDRVSEEAA